MLSEIINRYFPFFGLEYIIRFQKGPFLYRTKKSLSHLARFVALLELCLKLCLHFLILVFVFYIRLRIIIRPLCVLFRSLFCSSFFGGTFLLNLVKCVIFKFIK